MKRTSNRFFFGSGVALLLFSASAQAIIYQAENYNASYDTTAGNSGGAYRADNVDIEATADSGVASTSAGLRRASGWHSMV